MKDTIIIKIKNKKKKKKKEYKICNKVLNN